MMHANGTILAESERLRAHAVVETLSAIRHRGGTLGEVAHDARNMVAALALYCDLLAEPAVLNPEYAHYADELRLVTAASRRLVEKLVLIECGWPFEDGAGGSAVRGTAGFDAFPRSGRKTFKPEYGDRLPIFDLQQELLANRNLMDAISGLGIALAVRTEGGAHPVRLAAEDLTRVLVNLVKNATEAMRGSGSIEIALREMPGEEGGDPSLLLRIDDTGPGIPSQALKELFQAGYTTHTPGTDAFEGAELPPRHRGLGLFITRSIIDAAGGTITASNRPCGGASFEIRLPILALGKSAVHDR